MVKKNKKRIVITISNKTDEKLDYIVRNTNKTKSQIIDDLINGRTTINKLWKEIDYNALNDTDNVYYVKLLIENPFFENTSNIPLTELIKMNQTRAARLDLKILNEFNNKLHSLNTNIEEVDWLK